MNSICFISNKRTSLAARLFARAMACVPDLMSYRLVTTCSTDLELIIFRAWVSRERTADLVLPPDWNHQPNDTQKKILTQVTQSGGRLIETVKTDENMDARTMKVLRLAQLRVIIEISGDHWLHGWSHQLFRPDCTAVFQWAAESELNNGCVKLVETGRACPLYPRDWQTDFVKFLSGELDSGRRELRQLKLL